MQYRNDKYGCEISILGYGCMRFPKKNGAIDMAETEKHILKAIENGVNYFDTAYIYPGSEVALGKILAKNSCREKVKIATKLPQYVIKSAKSIEKYFVEQCSRLQTDYIDYYLMHMLTDEASWEKLCALGIKEWIAEKKAAGKIKNLGFSFHGNTETFLKILDAYDWDFCQIQYNYIDEHAQAGRKGLEAAAQKGIPVIVMEPLRGGRLVNTLPDSAKKMIATHESKRSAAEWAFRWLWNQKDIMCVLSGMNSIEMIDENSRVASEVQIDAFTQKDFDFIRKIKAEISKITKVPCTACGYCQPCPVGVNIPIAFHCYNEIALGGKKRAVREYMQNTIFKRNPGNASACIKCGKCEKHCPQHIEIRKELENAARALETPFYKLAKCAIRKFKVW